MKKKDLHALRDKDSFTIVLPTETREDLVRLAGLIAAQGFTVWCKKNTIFYRNKYKEERDTDLW